MQLAVKFYSFLLYCQSIGLHKLVLYNYIAVILSVNILYVVITCTITSLYVYVRLSAALAKSIYKMQGSNTIGEIMYEIQNHAV